MTSFTGFVQAGLQIGVDAIIIRPTRGIYGIQLPDGSQLPDIIAQATVEEHHNDELEITDHPVEQGAMISDHAYKRPAEVTLRLGWSNSPNGRGDLVNAALGAITANSPIARAAATLYGLTQAVTGVQAALSGAGVNQIQATYQQLLQLQESRALFVLYTGKRVYTNMVCKTLITETDYKNENALMVTMTCKQVILVGAQTVQLPQATQQDPQATATTVDRGTQNAIAVSDSKAALIAGSIIP
jgi:hypothetical protein